MASDGPLSALRSVPGGRRLFAISMLHTVTEYAAWVAVLIVAYQDSGATGSGRAVAFQLIPAAVAAPLVAAAGDRFPRHRVIQVALASIAAATAGIALALQADTNLAVVYLLAAVLSVAVTATPTSLASLMVHHARSPHQLTSLGVLTAIVKSFGVLLGPLVAAVVLAATEPAVLFFGLSAAALLGLGLMIVQSHPDDRVASSLRLRDVAGDTLSGLRYAIATRSVRSTLLFLTIAQLLIGALDVFLVTVAFDRLERGPGTAALLSTCLALGAVAASLSSTRYAIRVTLWRLAALGALLMSVPVVVLDRFDHAIPVALFVAIIGIGTALNDIGGLTLLQRVGSESMTSRIFGAFNSCALAAGALGALAAGRAINTFGLTASLVTAGVLCTLAFVLATRGLRDAQQQLPLVDAGRVAELRRVPFFAPLPLPTLERLVLTSQRRRFSGGEDLIVQGRIERDFFVLVEGRATIVVNGDVVNEVTAPDFFGEVALIHDIARTATVTTAGPGEVVTIAREQFLEAIALSASSQLAATTVAGSRLQSATDGGEPATTPG